MTTTTSFKAFAFGFIATAALAAGVVHAEVKRERAASVITLETVYITGKRVVAQQDVQTLPTVYITGHRSTEVAQQDVKTLPTVYVTGHRTTTVAENVQVAAL